jgi:hypothetical protein
MIHNAECHIVIEAPQMGALKAMMNPEPPPPSDAEKEEVFPGWRNKQKIFVGRCLQEEDRDWDTLSPQDLFRFGMKFVICEAKKLI